MCSSPVKVSGFWIRAGSIRPMPARQHSSRIKEVKSIFFALKIFFSLFKIRSSFPQIDYPILYLLNGEGAMSQIINNFLQKKHAGSLRAFGIFRKAYRMQYCSMYFSMLARTEAYSGFSFRYSWMSATVMMA